MNLYFVKYKFLSITWFMFFAIFSILISYIIVSFTRKDYGFQKDKIENIFFSIIIFSFIGARLSYVLFNISSYKDNLLSILTLSHYNLSLLGGIVSSFLVILFYSKKYNINFNKIVSVLSIPFYFSMMIGIWSVYFDRLMYPLITESKMQSILVGFSFVFFVGILLESIIKRKNKYFPTILLTVIVICYYVLKSIAL